MSMAAPSIKAMAEKRVRRQKQIIAVGSLVLLAILGFELPKLLGGHESDAAPAVTTSSPAANAASAPPAKLPDTDKFVVQRDSNQLVSFGLFQSKDPFVQQLNPEAVAPSPPKPKAPIEPKQPKPLGSDTTVPAVPAVPAPTVPASTTPGQPPTAPTATITTPAAPTTAPSTVLLSTNGVCEQVALNGTFPRNEDIFRVVWIAKDGKSIKVSVVGGSFDNGQPTATIKLGKKLTLVNTADGTRYVIALETRCDVVAPAADETATTPVNVPTTPQTTTAPLPPPPPTTPIVTDSADTTVPTG
jgi:hypothetical protein